MTTKTQHTPGPWLIDADGDIQDSQGNKIADMHITSEPDKAVMAAAPEMLEALREFVRVMESAKTTTSMPHTVAKVRAAIAKAEGRDQRVNHYQSPEWAEYQAKAEGRGQ